MALKNTVTRENEINVIAYRITNSDDIILGRTHSKLWVVRTCDGIFNFSDDEMEELYILDMENSDLERLTWSA